MQAKEQFRQAMQLAGKGDLDAAEELCRSAVGVDAEDFNALALLGAILLKTGRVEEAEPQLLRASEVAPTFAKPREDLAILYMQREDYKSAAACFEDAARIAPRQASLLLGLSHALQKLDRNTQAASAYRRYLTLSSRPCTLADVSALRQLGDLEHARVECGRLLAREPDNLQAMRQLAIIAAEQGRASEAERLLNRIVELAPDALVPVTDLAHLCNDQKRFMESIHWFRRALELSPDTADLHMALAGALMIVGEAEAALDAYSDCYRLAPEQHDVLLGQGHALRVLGRSEEALDKYRQCAKIDGLFADACWALASMRSDGVSDVELEQMLNCLARDSIDDRDAIHLDFAVARVLDERGRFAEAWGHYAAANARKRSEVQYDAVAIEARVDWLIETYDTTLCDRARLDVDPAGQSAEATPIFVVGLPRSGSTLVEQILASHSMVQGTTELPYLEGIARRLRAIGQQPAGAISLAEFDGSRWLGLGNEYLAACAAHIDGNTRYFVDKLPDNFYNIGFIHLALPNALVIDARRDPIDTCVANFRQLFAQGKDFSYDLVELGELALQYHRLMRHWDEVMPTKVLTLQYEDLVRDSETQIRRLIGHCRLAWEDACLDFNNTHRVVTTASSEQVRRPIYADSVGYWRRYEPHLGELLEVLEPLID
jgi:tetratricopeptide (TPR) repeat protein